jgi:hypothetical protein
VKHEIYVFGSLCRGDISATSDVDVLVIPFGRNKSEFPREWSIYSPELLAEYFRKGRLFAWHLHLEAKCVFSPHEIAFLERLGPPAPYSTITDDIDELAILLQEALDELAAGTKNVIYELGIAYTAIRDLAMSASWSLLDAPCFAADAPFRLPLAFPLSRFTFDQIRLARHASTRGAMLNFEPTKTARTIIEAPIERWVHSLRRAVS